jgi:hypothetical protein
MNISAITAHFKLALRKKNIFMTTPPYINGMQGGVDLVRIVKKGTGTLMRVLIK